MKPVAVSKTEEALFETLTKLINVGWQPYCSPALWARGAEPPWRSVPFCRKWFDVHVQVFWGGGGGIKCNWLIYNLHPPSMHKTIFQNQHCCCLGCETLVEGFAAGLLVLVQPYTEVSATCIIHVQLILFRSVGSRWASLTFLCFHATLPSSQLSNHLIFPLLLHGMNSLVPERSMLETRIREFLLYWVGN